jgi:hypothetical protein
VAEDFNRDGAYDLALSTLVSSSVRILFGDRHGKSAISSATYCAAHYPNALAADDFNEDGHWSHWDLATADSGAGTVSVLIGNGNGTLSSAASYAVGGYPYSRAADEFNGDGNADLAAANANDGTVSILLGYGNGSFSRCQKFNR